MCCRNQNTNIFRNKDENMNCSHSLPVPQMVIQGLEVPLRFQSNIRVTLLANEEGLHNKVNYNNQFLSKIILPEATVYM
jgi:hypothetical protein